MKQTTSKTGLAINENIIKIDLKTVGSEGVDWISLDQDRSEWVGLVNFVVSL